MGSAITLPSLTIEGANMKTIFTIILSLALLLPLQLNTQTASKIPSVTFGEQVFTSLDGTEFWLSAAGGSNGFTTFSRLTREGGVPTRHYQIPDATNLRVIGLRHSSGANLSQCTISYSDIAAIDNGTYAAKTTPVNIVTGTTTPLAVTDYPFVAGNVGTVRSWFINWLIDVASTPGKFLFAGCDGVIWRIKVLVREETP